MFDWFWNMLSALGFGSKEARILILGASLSAAQPAAQPATRLKQRPRPDPTCALPLQGSTTRARRR